MGGRPTPRRPTGRQPPPTQHRRAASNRAEVSWVCTNDRNEQTQERARTTETETQGVVSAAARERNQITGFNLTGYQGAGSDCSPTSS